MIKITSSLHNTPDNEEVPQLSAFMVFNVLSKNQENSFHGFSSSFDFKAKT